LTAKKKTMDSQLIRSPVNAVAKAQPLNPIAAFFELKRKMLQYLVLGVALLFLLDWATKKTKKVGNDTVLITGAGSGLGRLLALKFSKEGSRLVLWDLNEESVKKVAEECEKAGAKKTYYQKIDLSKREQIRECAEKVRQEMGDVDILVNNAGIVTGKTLLECTEEQMVKTVEVNLMALFWTTRAFLPKMIEKNHGHIINISSMAGLVGVNGLADYCASKAGVFQFNESVRFELQRKGKYGVKTTVVCPFYINTGMFDGAKTRFSFLLPIMEPDYVVDRIFKAILISQEVLIMPWFASLITLARGAMPTRAFDLLMNFLGVNATMDQFKGRK